MSRAGDVIACVEQPAAVASALEAAVLWASDQPLDPEREYLLKAGTAKVPARIEARGRVSTSRRARWSS